MTAPFQEMAEAAWGRILPFLRPIEALIRDPEISDIMINGEQAVFFEKDGRIERASGVTIPERSLQVAARNIARALGGEISEESPSLIPGSRTARAWRSCWRPFRWTARRSVSESSRTGVTTQRNLCASARSRRKSSPI